MARKSIVKFSTIPAGIFLTVLSLNSLAGDTDGLRKSLMAKMPGTQIGAITKTPYAGLYEVVANGINVFYTDKKGDIALIGKLIDLKTQQDLAERRMQELRKIDFAKLPLEQAIVKVKGDGSRKLAVFSDPDCPFCKQLEKELESVSNVTIYTFLFPLTELHPDSLRKAESIWCSKDRAQAWDDLMLKEKEPVAADNKNCETPIRAISGLAHKLWITGTPGMIFGSGKLVPGVLPGKQIEEMLNDSGKS